MSEGGVKELSIIIKADVQGSAEVLADTLTKLSDERVKIRIIHTGVGAINESDVLLATASNAIIIGFNVRPDRNAADVAERERVDIRQHSVIYNVTDEIKKAMAGLLEPTIKETRVGTAEVRQIFKTPKVGTVAGCLVVDGRMTRSGEAQARLLRDNVVVWQGRLASLRRFKDDVSEVKAGLECGIALERFNDRLKQSGRTLVLCGARHQPAEFLDQAEFVSHVGKDNIVPHVQAALDRAREIRSRFSGVAEAAARDLEHASL